MNDRYSQFKDEQQKAKDALVVVTLGVGGVSALVAAATMARIAMNPLSPFNFLRTPVALGAAAAAAASAVAVKKLRDCDKGNTPCP